MNHQSEPRQRYEYRVIWQYSTWVRPRWKLFQMQFYANRFADWLDEGQDKFGLLRELKIERRPVGEWVEYYD